LRFLRSLSYTLRATHASPCTKSFLTSRFGACLAHAVAIKWAGSASRLDAPHRGRQDDWFAAVGLLNLAMSLAQPTGWQHEASAGGHNPFRSRRRCRLELDIKRNVTRLKVSASDIASQTKLRLGTAVISDSSCDALCQKRSLASYIATGDATIGDRADSYPSCARHSRTPTTFVKSLLGFLYRKQRQSDVGALTKTRGNSGRRHSRL
jgi:hypothetical protein